MAQAIASPQGSKQTVDKNAIRLFPKVSVPEAELTELRRRINATRWPERETVTDATQGVQLATAQALASYWAKEYDWRKVEARMNALPQFITEIDGLGHSFRSCPFKTRKCAAADRFARMARLGRRAAQDHRSGHQILRPMAEAHQTPSMW